METLHYQDFKRSFIPEILKEIYIDKIYQNYTKYMTDEVVLDIGGNIGLFSQYAHYHAKKIYLIEPCKDHLESARLNVAGWDNVEVVPYAISTKTGKQTFYLQGNATCNTLSENLDLGKPEEVDCITLEDLWTKYKLDEVGFAKIDVEGSEFDILSHPSFNKISPKIRSIVIECHEWSRTNPHQLVSVLIDNGYEVEKINTSGMVFGAYRNE
jgi:FkbM family methyltransferase